MFGTPLVLPAQFPAAPEDDSSQFLSQLGKTFSGSLSPTLSHTPPPSIPSQLLSSHFVFVRNPPNSSSLSPAYAGPYKVLKRSPHHFTLQIGSRTDTISVHHLKHAELPAQTLPAQPTARGRPPKSILRSPQSSFPSPSSSVTFSLPLPTSSSHFLSTSPQYPPTSPI